MTATSPRLSRAMSDYLAVSRSQDFASPADRDLAEERAWEELTRALSEEGLDIFSADAGAEDAADIPGFDEISDTETAEN